MRPRNDILAVFSTFIQFAEDRFEQWMTVSHLAKRMKHLLSQHEQSEKDWALYWYEQRDSNPQAIEHLWAYLQEPCYRAAERVTSRFPMVQYSVADSFQIAIIHIERILQGYNPSYGSSLKAYAQTSFGNYIRDHLRQKQEIHISSDWGLLRRLSQAQLHEALLATGFIHTAALILLWQCFRAVCPPSPDRSVRGLPAPSAEQLAAIAKRFKQFQHQLPAQESECLHGSPWPSLDDPQQLKQELIQLATLARNYLTPTISSLNQPQYDDSTEEQLNTVPTQDEPPMAQLLASETYQERQAIMQQIGQVLVASLQTLTEIERTLLVLYYQNQLTQSAIAKRINIQQYQVSRQLRRIRQKLLLSVVHWGKTTLHISLDCNVLEDVSEVIHEWLQRHYSPEPPEDSK